MPELRAIDMSLCLGGEAIVSDVSLGVKPGEFLAVVGPSGAGKSTLLGALSGELRPSGGEVTLGAKPLARWRLDALAGVRAFLPQSPSLSFPFPVIDVVLMGRQPLHDGGIRWVDEVLARDCLRLVGIEHLAERAYTTLSGGERQRVHFARVLAQVGPERRDPRYLLLDEPTSQLDVAHAFSALRVAREFCALGVGVICVLHDLNLAARFADTVALLAQGRLQALGPPEHVFTTELLATHFGVDADIVDHPATGALQVVVLGDRLSHSQETTPC
ncbi:heme ABC transporter ATP-binding protein [Lujinxingia litoralis]|uniref:Heme ABC transporter ATP-binding protein n=1 Tax=Lujinxingia litoralis TaxID=2211119 RepID=A0A328C4U5_9DELT|nr:heme ABC transporter ATP-binding protein [Lujinxingia litoralis]RAL20332.1 heme ABC transporter ATP-binding protein [Lujinxingia litoralis]